MAELSIPSSEFVLSCPNVKSAPKRSLPEIAFVGRSNAGKSSVINSLLNRRRLAHSSKTPGKTRLLNYYRIGDGLCYFVDLPGYGYAAVAKQERADWGPFFEDYMRDSVRLKLVVLILDIRRGMTELDDVMADAAVICNRPWIAVLNKCDKLGSSAFKKAMEVASGELISRGSRNVVAYSALHHTGRETLWSEIRSAADSINH